MSILGLKNTSDSQLLAKYNQYLDGCFAAGTAAVSFEDFKRGKR